MSFLWQSIRNIFNFFASNLCKDWCDPRYANIAPLWWGQLVGIWTQQCCLPTNISFCFKSNFAKLHFHALHIEIHLYTLGNKGLIFWEPVLLFLLCSATGIDKLIWTWQKCVGSWPGSVYRWADTKFTRWICWSWGRGMLLLGLGLGFCTLYCNAMLMT